MRTRIGVVIAFIFLLPAFANAWTVNAKTTPAAGQGTISPSGNTVYPAGVNSGEYTVSPAAGYSVARVTLDGAPIPPNANGKYVAPYLAGKTWRYMVAYFIGGTVSITTQITAGSGAIREDTFESLTSIPVGANRQILVIPNTGYRIASLTAPGATSVTNNPDGTKTVIYNNLQANQTVSAGFSLVPAVTVSAGPDVATTGNALAYAATLLGSATSNQGAISYAWTGAGLVFGEPTAATTTVYATTPGSYTATLTVTSGSEVKTDTAIVTVVGRAAYLEAFCSGCHSGNTPQVVIDYDASGHKAKQVSCQDCHTATPHTGVKAACSDCHSPGNSLGLPWPPAGLDFHNDYTGSNLCSNCHNLHNPGLVTGMAGTPHYNDITSAGYPASYVTSKAACADCHYNSPANASHRQEWNKSGHAATTDRPWIVEDFKTMPGCVQCHTTTGFIAYSTGKVTAAWGLASDRTKEVLRCNGCHKDVPNGIVRTIAPVRPYADDPYINRDLGKSNICMSCHSGVRNGASITVQLDALADFTNLPFIDPHNHASGGNLHGKSGYHFPGQTYAFYSTNSHRRIGIAGFNGSGTSGPCIACHRNDTNSHTNKSLINTLCGNCHGASFTVDQLTVDKQAYTNALVSLNAMLDAKGHRYSPTPPNFSNTNWGVGQEGANTMGAAFNYVMLRYDNGAYAHNSAYAKQLIFDSIDYLYNGSITGSIEGALSYLVANNRITGEAADSVKSYKAEINCTICHTYSSGSHPAHLNSGSGCADCHSTTAATNTTIVPGNTTHVNGVPDVAAGPGRTFSYSGATCSSISCHNNGTATWGGTLGCDGCHDAPPATASHLKHYGGTIAQAGYGNTGIAQDSSANSAVYSMNCGNCHPMDRARHGNGIVEIELYNPLAPAGSLKALNPASAAYVPGDTPFTDARGLTYTRGTCSSVYCHSYNVWTTTGAIPDSDPDWQAKVVVTRNYRTITWGGAPLGCSGCHANPPQTSEPGNVAGAGDSHSWTNSYGWQYLHTWNMYGEPVSCSYCHNDTVKQLNTYTYDGIGANTLGEVPISNFSRHVNGINDVSFDRQNPYVYPATQGDGSHSLANATYVPAEKTCLNVSCHLQQTTVKWGTPYRGEWGSNECNVCHQY